MRNTFKIYSGSQEKQLILVHDLQAIRDTMMILVHDRNEKHQFGQLVINIGDNVWEIMPDGLDTKFASKIIDELEKFFSDFEYKFFVRSYKND